MELLRNQKRLNSSKRFFPGSWSLPVQLFIAPCPILPCNLSVPVCHPCCVSTSLFSKASQTLLLLTAPVGSDLSKTWALPDLAKSGFTMSAGSSSLCPTAWGWGPELVPNTVCPFFLVLCHTLPLAIYPSPKGHSHLLLWRIWLLTPACAFLPQEMEATAT